jgi:hypothetical protein
MSGIFRRKGDESDVITYMHSDAPERCGEIWARPNHEPSVELTNLGTVDDIGDWPAALKQSDFGAVIRLGPEGKVAGTLFRLRQWLRRLQRRLFI